MLQWILVFLTLIVTAYMFFNANMSSIYSLIQTDVILGYVFIGVAWTIISGNSSKFPIAIIPNKSISKHNYLHSKREGSTFNTISSILSVPFVLMVLIFTYVALGNPQHITIIHFNAFGEFWVELIAFTVVGVFLIINAVLNVKKLRGAKNGEV